MLALLALVFISTAFLFRFGIPCRDLRLAVLGSGGHTGELLTMLASSRPEPTVFVHGEDDLLSVERARRLDFSATFVSLPRARKVHQSFTSSVFTSLYTFFFAVRCLVQLRPRIIICNGPGTGLVVILAARLLLLQTKVLYIESFARVHTLSLTGKLVYSLHLANKFLVQWKELQLKYPTTEYIGPLV